MALFENGREANRVSSIAMIEGVLEELGYDPAATRSNDPQQPTWGIGHGSASIVVSLVDRDEFVHLRVVAPVMTTDARVDVLKLYRRLLTLNAEEVHGAAFAAHRNEIHLIAERSTLDLDRSEVRDSIERVRAYADHYDDLLVDEFGGRVGAG